MRKLNKKPWFPYHIWQRLSCFVVVAVILFQTISFGASGLIQISPSDTYAVAEAEINKYSVDKSIQYTVAESKALLSPSGHDYAYTLYALEPYGYAVLFDETNDLMEANYAEGAILPVDIDSLDDYYYGGPTVYYVSDAGQSRCVDTNKLLSSDDIAGIAANEGRVRSENAQKVSNADSQNTRGIIVTYKVGQNYFAHLNNHGNNVNGTCTVVAACMLLRYYDYYVSDAYVASIYHSGTGTTNSFHELMNDYVYGSDEEGGIFIHDAIPEINYYLSTRSVRSRLLSENENHLNVSAEIINRLAVDGYPVIASFNNNVWNHSVVVYGVQYDDYDPVETAKYTCHMGWSSTYNAYVIDGCWFYEVGWIGCGMASHNYNGKYESVSALQHRHYCQCGAYTLGAHSLSTDETGARYCTLCGWRNNTVLTTTEEMFECG